jgi:uncharacterized membrane protein YhaH (DUF805 family)
MLNNVYKLFFSRLFLFKGRSNRKEYIVRILLYTTIIVIWTYTIDTYGNEDTLFSFLYVISLGSIGILMFLQYFPLAVRRFHDLNASGWWVLLSFLPFGQVVILWLMFKKGTSGINKYGEEPLN